MTILYPSPVSVKSRKFGAGILRSLPTYRAPFTAADEAWLQADNARREHEAIIAAREEAEADLYDRHVDELYERSIETAEWRGLDYLSHEA